MGKSRHRKAETKGPSATTPASVPDPGLSWSWEPWEGSQTLPRGPAGGQADSLRTRVAFALPGFWLAPLAVFLALLFLYVATLTPSVMGGDSGELISAALTGGVPHPPGYPLFALLARAFAALPIGPSPAWRVNLLSAVSTAAAAGCLCALLQAWTRDRSAALVGAVLFGANTVVWYHATSAEIFGLHAFFLALAFLLWVAIERTGSRGFLLALAFVCGLALSNQHTFILTGLPLLLRSLWVTRQRLRRRDIAGVLVLGLLGLFPYAYLPAAGASNAAVSWGDQTSWRGFLVHVLRLEYGSFGLGRAVPGSAFTTEGTFGPTLWALLGHGVPRFAWVGLPLALVGFHRVTRQQPHAKELPLLAVALVLYIVVFCELANLDPRGELYLTEVSRFFIQPDLMLAIAAGLGCAGLLAWLRRRWPLLERRPGLAYVVPVATLAWCLAVNGEAASRRGDTVFADFAATALRSLPANAIVLTHGDHVSGAVAYLHEVEGARPDVIHLDRDMLGLPWYGQRKRRLHPGLYLPDRGYGKLGYDIKQVLDGNPTRPVTVIDKLDEWDQSWNQGYKLVTHGLVHSLVPAGQFPSFRAWEARDREAMGHFDVSAALRFPKGTWENALGQMVLSTQGLRGHIAVVYAMQGGPDPAAARVATGLLEDLVAKTGGDARLGIAGAAGLPSMLVAASIWRDLGIGYEILARQDPSYAARVPIAVERFLDRAPPDSGEVPAARKYLEMHKARMGRP